MVFDVTYFASGFGLIILSFGVGVVIGTALELLRIGQTTL